MDRLTKLETGLKRAAESLQYEAVERLATDYGDAARAVLASLNGEEAAGTIRRVTEMLEWARMVLLTGRAISIDQLRRIPLVKGYLQTTQSPRRTLQIDL